MITQMNLQNPEVLRQKAEVEVKRKQPLRLNRCVLHHASVLLAQSTGYRDPATNPAQPFLPRHLSHPHPLLHAHRHACKCALLPVTQAAVEHP